MAGGGYDGTAGSPPGSLADKTEIAIGLVGLFTAEAVEMSPAFTATESGSGSLTLDRQFENAELASLTPTVEYTANLVDKSTGNKQKAISEIVGGATAFAPKQGPVVLVAGHSYAIEIDATTKSSVASIGLLGSVTFRLDNVSVTGPGGGGGNSGGGAGGGNGGNGANGGEGENIGINANNSLTSSELASILTSQGLTGPAVLKGNRITVKSKCPAKLGATCTLSLQGMLNRHKAATASRRARVKKGKTKQFALVIKPAARKTVKAKKKLLFKETARVGQTKATVWKSLKLIRK